MIYKNNNEITLRTGGCGCCAQYSMLIVDQNKQPIPYNDETEYQYYYKQIELTEVIKERESLMKQIELLNELENMLTSVQKLDT